MTTHMTIKATGSVPELVKVLATHHEGEFPNLIKMEDWGLALALSTADCERDFSVLKLIKTARRNRLSNKSLEQIMAIKIDAPPLAAFPFDAALKIWHTATVPRTTTASLTTGEQEALQQEATAFVPASVCPAARSTAASCPAISQAPSTANIVSSGAPQSSCASASAAARPPSLSSATQFQQMVEPFLNQMPGSLAIQLHQWIQQLSTNDAQPAPRPIKCN